MDKLAEINQRLQAIQARLDELSGAVVSGYVYLLTDGNSHYKIGQTKDVDRRIKGLSTSTARQLDLLCAIETPISGRLELSLHRIYRRQGRHIRNEWYALTSDDVDAICSLPSPLYADDLDVALLQVEATAKRSVAPSVVVVPNDPTTLTPAHPKADRIRALILSGASSSSIIHEVWGVRGGSAYQTAARELAAITATFLK